MSKTLSKYTTAFDYLDKVLAVFYLTLQVLVALSISAPVRITSATFSLVFSISNWIANF